MDNTVKIDVRVNENYYFDRNNDGITFFFSILRFDSDRAQRNYSIPLQSKFSGYELPTQPKIHGPLSTGHTYRHTLRDVPTYRRV